jgi:hypothetical protein
VNLSLFADRFQLSGSFEFWARFHAQIIRACLRSTEAVSVAGVSFPHGVSTERVEGPTPNGGAYSIVVKDEKGRILEITEYRADGTAIFRTYSEVMVKEVMGRPDAATPLSTIDLLAFGVGFSNFGTGREIRMATIPDTLNQMHGDTFRVVRQYDATGNLRIQSSVPREQVGLALREATGRERAVLPTEEVRHALVVDEHARQPEPEHGVRWTPGLAFAVTGSVEPIDPWQTPHGWFHRLDASIVGVFKRDLLDERGNLDRARRRGGWGAISRDLRHKFAGTTWTARSHTSAAGLLRPSSQH